MKFIVEYLDNKIKPRIELDESTGKKSFVLEGIFAQAEVANRNGRVYPKSVLERAIYNYDKNYVSKNRALGEVNHPSTPTVDYMKVSHMITELNWKTNNVIGKAKVLNTPAGNVISGLMKDGVSIGVSTRGMGSLEERDGSKYVKNDYVLNAIDIVHDPSAPEAFVNGIMEGVEWVSNNGAFRPVKIESLQKQFKRSSIKEANQIALEELTDLLVNTYHKRIKR